MKKQKISLVILFSVATLCASGFAEASMTDGGIITNNKNDGYAWGSQIGWLNFAAPNSNIRITDNGIAGYVWNANYGWINMSPLDGGVWVSRDGKLSGNAWNDNLGWIDFSGISIDDSGKFTGQLDGEKTGIINFDCKNCIVYTDYRPSIYRLEPYIGKERKKALSQKSNTNQLLDIRLLIDKTEISKLQDLSAHATFENFGNVPTSVDMTFAIVDPDGKEIWKEKNMTTVQTEAVYNRDFSYTPDVPDGKYVLRLDTSYGDNIKDTLTMPFSIKSDKSQNVNAIENYKGNNTVPAVIACIFLLIVIVGVVVLNKRIKFKKKK